MIEILKKTEFNLKAVTSEIEINLKDKISNVDLISYKNINDSIIKERMGVQPQYSLKPYHQLLSDEPEKYVYKEIEAKLAN